MSKEHVQPRKVQVCRHTVITPISEALVIERSDAAGLCLTIKHIGTSHMGSTFCANGLMDVVPRQPFIILVIKYTNAQKQLPKLGGSMK